MKVTKKFWTWALGVLSALVFLVGLSGVALADAGDVPAHGKTIHDNGDGTYKLELSVTGDADTEVETAANVNVLIIYDESSSMTSNNVTTNPNRNRADYAEDVVHDFIESLRGYQNTSDPSNIQVAVVGFGPTATTRQNWTSDLTGGSNGANRWFDDGVDGTVTSGHNYTRNNGTNWEAALQQAIRVLNSADSDPTFVILVTDGACTASGNGNNAINPAGNHQWTDFQPFYNAARDEALTIQNRANTTLFGIYAYGREADLLDDLIYYALNGSDRPGMNGGTVDTNQYYNANDTSALTQAVEDIFQTIVNALGVSSVSIADGTTNQVTTSTGVAELLEVDESSYQYWLSIPVVNNQFQRIDLVSGETVTYTVTSNGDGTCTVAWPGNSVTVKGTVSGGQLKYEWTGKNALYNYDPPAASFTNGTVNWDLSSVGTLLDGVTYSVTFDVYPSQTTLDIVADIKNDPSSYNSLDPAIKQYIDAQGNLKTNTTATLTYSDTRLDNPGPKTSTYKNPGPVENKTVEELAVAKDWKNLLESQWTKPESIVLNVTRDGEEHYTVNLNDGNDWENKVFISIGIMRTNDEGVMEVLEGSEGHDFTFTEPPDLTYHWEIDVPTVHPMMIDGVVTMLIKADEKHPVPTGATTYTITDYNGVESTYYVDNDPDAVRLTATNERRSSINIKKVVDGEDAPDDAIFPFTLNVENSLAPENEPQNDPNHESDYWVWISVRDMSETDDPEQAPPVTDAVVSGATSAGDGWYYAPSDTNIVLNVKNGYSIRINNLPTGSEYTITEGSELPTGFVYDSTDVALLEGEGVWDYTAGRTTTGTVDTTNAVYGITFNNTYKLVDIEVDKVWDDNSDQDGMRPEELALTLNGVPSGTNVPEPTITVSEDGNTWTYKWSGLPRYDTSGAEIGYSVTEENVPENYTCEETAAQDHGTITNVHTPEVTNVTVNKIWDDNNNVGEIRPTSISVQLKADGTASGDSVTLNDSNEWSYTWEGLPKYKDGKLIAYTADETAVPTGYTEQDPVVTTTEAGTTITITNIYTPTPVTASFPVQKVLEVPEGLTGPSTWSYNITVAAQNGAPEAQTMTGTVTNTTDTVTFGDFTFTMPGTYTYNVTESGIVPGVTNDEAAETGKTVTVTVEDNGDGTLTATASSTTDKPLTFTNTYAVEETDVEIGGNKVLTGVDPENISNYEFKFLLRDADGNIVANGSVNGQGEFTFDEKLTYTQDDMADAENGEKTYEYTATEENGGEAGMTYDATIFTVFVRVYDDAKGQLQTEVTYEANGESADGIEFENTFVPGSSSPTGEGNLTVTKVLTDADGKKLNLAGGDFTFTLTPATGAPGETQTKTNAADGSVSFDAIEFTETGDFEYVIDEVEGTNPAITYDQNTYTVVAHVEDAVDDAGEHYLAVTWSIKGSEETDITFTNVYDTPKKDVFLGSSTTSIDGEVVQPGDTLTYSITYTNPTGKDASVTITDEIPAHTTFVTADHEGSEANGTITWNLTVEKDATVTVTFEVTVDDDADGATLTNDAIVNDGVNEYTTNEVTNPTPPDVPSSPTGEGNLTVTKELDGRALKADEFEFTLTPVGDAPGTAQTKKNAADGSVSFDEITFIKTGEFRYTVAEAKGSLGGVTYDESTYTVVATVTQDPNDATKLIVTWSIEGSDETAIVFKNTYEASGTVSFPVEKDLVVPTGLKGPEGASWTVTLTAGTNTAGVETPMPTTTTGTITPDAGMTFGAITFAKPGEYTYTVTESGIVPGVTNDTEAAKTVTVTVVDNGDGTLTATASSTTDEPLTFTNTYGITTPDRVDPPVQKVYDVPAGLNAPSIEGKFTFTITNTSKPEGVETAPMPDNTSITNSEQYLLEGETDLYEFGWITFTVPGTYVYTVTESGSVPGVTNDSAASSGKTITVTVTDNGDGTVTAEMDPAVGRWSFTNTYSVKAVELELSAGKKLEVEAPATKAPDVSGKYTLTLAATDGAPLPEGATDGKVEITNADGNGTMTGFGKISFTAPGEYQYTVSESGSVPGVANGTESYTVVVKVSDNGDGTLKAEVISGSQETLFTNTYKVTPVEIEKGFEVTKQLNGAPLAGGAFTFKLTAGTNNAGVPTPMPASDTVTNNDEGKATFGTITYKAPGTYNYTITEVNGGTTANGTTYDGHTVNVKVVVTDNGDGTLKAEVSYEGSTTFVNTYEASGDLRLTVSKTLNGATLSEGQFTFELVDEGGKVIQTKTNDASGAVTFDPITYDNSIFDEDATTVDGGTGEAPNDEAIEAETTEPATNEAEATFADTLGKGEATEPEATEPAAGEATEPAAAEPEATEPAATETEPAAEEPNLLADLAEFLGLNRLFAPTVAYAADSNRTTTVKYTIREVNDGKPGYTYDRHEVAVTVTVTDNGDGTLTATPAYEGSTTFVNTYAASGSTVLEGTKSVTGTELKDGQFSFQLKDSTGKVIETVTNAADGSFAFSELKFTEADAGKTYEYTITEVNDGQAGYTYDSHVCNVSVKVTDNGDGTLTCEPSYDGDTEFVNPYKPLACSIPLTATKTLEGRDLKAGEFTFELSFVSGGETKTKTATNATDGTIDFGSFLFSEEGTYEFTVTEVKGTDSTITYDESELTFVVEVVDEDGQLVATVTNEGEQTFKNTYTPPVVPPAPEPEPPVIPETGDATSIAAMATAALAGIASVTAGLALRRRED